jgi:hypothetical protein
MNEQFNNWWNGDDLTKDNPFRRYSPAFWAWEGWVAGVKAEREACMEACYGVDKEYEGDSVSATWCADAIRARSKNDTR